MEPRDRRSIQLWVGWGADKDIQMQLKRLCTVVPSLVTVSRFYSPTGMYRIRF